MKKRSETELYREALEKARAVCSRQEKCASEILARLQTYGLDPAMASLALKTLEKEGYVDDRRYAGAFARDKSRLARWGKLRISQALRQKKIDEVLIGEALAGLPDEQYEEQLLQELRKKLKTIPPGNPYARKARLFRFAAGRGYEHSLIYAALEKLLGDEA